MLQLKHSFEPNNHLPNGKYRKYSTGQKNGIDVFGYNSAEREPIWMKSGTV